MFNHMVDSISVRDADSQRALEAAGVFRSIVRIPDLIFQLEIPQTGVKAPEKIGLAISPWPQRMGWDQDIAFLLDRISQQWNVSLELLVFFPEQDGPLAQADCRKMHGACDGASMAERGRHFELDAFLPAGRRDALSCARAGGIG